MKALALFVVAASACSHPDACERAAGGFTAGYLRYANPKPDVETLTNPHVETLTNRLAERFEPMLVERCRDDGWSAEATRCDQDAQCLMSALTALQRDKLQAAIAKLVDSAQHDFMRDRYGVPE